MCLCLYIYMLWWISLSLSIILCIKYVFFFSEEYGCAWIHLLLKKTLCTERCIIIDDPCDVQILDVNKKQRHRNGNREGDVYRKSSFLHTSASPKTMLKLLFNGRETSASNMCTAWKLGVFQQKECFGALYMHKKGTQKQQTTPTCQNVVSFLHDHLMPAARKIQIYTPISCDLSIPTFLC